MKRVHAIVLSAGKGTRMKSEISKQYMPVNGRPILYYTLKAFEQSDVDDIIIVAAEADIEYVRNEIVKQYGLTKVSDIVGGGKERYDSVINGLNVLEDRDYVLIHDGARPLIRSEEINRMISEVQMGNSCVAGMPVKDTIKIADEEGFVISTPDRKTVWQIQTPQAFEVSLIKKAYRLMKEAQDDSVTDDAMAVERYTGAKIKLIPASYENIKITTPEDLIFMNGILNHQL